MDMMEYLMDMMMGRLVLLVGLDILGGLVDLGVPVGLLVLDIHRVLLILSLPLVLVDLLVLHIHLLLFLLEVHMVLLLPLDLGNHLLLSLPYVL